MNRRDFLYAAAAGPLARPAATPSKMIGIQAGAVSFADEGVEQVLDIFQQRAYVNTIFLAVFTYGRGIAGRQVPGQPLPDHGKQEYDEGTFYGGNYATPRAQFYKDTVLRPEHARDLGSLDILEAVLPAARKRGMKTICWMEDVWRTDLPNIGQVQERDLYGRNASTLCFNNPNYRNFLLGLVEDYARSYEIDGIMWGSERQGALGNALGSRHGGAQSDPSRVTCFCSFCQGKARARGVNFERAREGFREIEKFVRAGRAGKRPVDGYYVTFWRILMRYPEVLAWEQLWHDSLRETYAAIYERVKSVKPNVPVGWHIWHNNSFSPLYRAEQDLQVLSKYSDFLKMVIYDNCGGERLAGYIDSVGATLYGDVPHQELLDFHDRVMDYQHESYEKIPLAGLGSDYVYRECKRAVAGAAGTKTLIWPGLDIDIPTASNHSKSTPESVKAAVLAAFHAGSHGVLLSRKYSEMKLANLGGAGAAIKELGLA